MQKPLDLSDEAPWKARFRDARIETSQLATQNPDKGVVITNKDGIFQVYAWDVPSGQLTAITDRPTGTRSGTISADGQRIYYLHDEAGDEIGHYHFKPFDGGEAVDISPDMPAYASFYFTESYTGRHYGFQAGNQYGFFIFVIDNVEGGLPVFRYETQHLCAGPMLSYDAEVAVIATTERARTLHYNLEAYDVRTGDKLHDLWDGPGTSITPVGFAKREGDMRFLASSSVSGYPRPLIWNTRTGERFDLPVDDIAGDVVPWDWSTDGQTILLRQMHNAEARLWLYDTRSQSTTRLDHPAGDIIQAYFSPQGTIFAHWQDATHPLQLVELDGQTGQLLRTVLAAAQPLPGRNWRSVSFPTDDGSPIQAWLATPEGNGPFPTIVHTHGGPTSVMKAAYNPDAQTFVEHGFAFFSINYRGSTTFGKAFQDAILGNLGDLEVRDIEAGARWLVEQGIADPDALVLYGRSYGGYLTLQTLGKAPGLWAGGMAHVAIADWRLMYEDMAETLRGYQRALFGGAPDDVPDVTLKSSPITYAENVKAPLLIVQGRNDTRCPERQMQVYVEKLNELGNPPEIHWYDAGHAAFDTRDQIRHMEYMLNFLYRILG